MHEFIANLAGHFTSGILAAEYTNASKRRSATLTITHIENGHRKVLREYAVTGKRHARELAKDQGAQPWNF